MAIKMYFSFSCKNIIKTFVFTCDDYTAFDSNILYNNKK